MATKLVKGSPCILGKIGRRQPVHCVVGKVVLPHLAVVRTLPDNAHDVAVVLDGLQILFYYPFGMRCANINEQQWNEHREEQGSVFYNPTFNPIDKVVELYERMLKEKDALIEKLLHEKNKIQKPLTERLYC